THRPLRSGRALRSGLAWLSIGSLRTLRTCRPSRARSSRLAWLSVRTLRSHGARRPFWALRALRALRPRGAGRAMRLGADHDRALRVARIRRADLEVGQVVVRILAAVASTKRSSRPAERAGRGPFGLRCFAERDEVAPLRARRTRRASAVVEHLRPEHDLALG